MSFKALSAPAVSVNNEPISITPNTFKYKPGYGEVTVRSASTGGRASTTIHTENTENKVGCVKFSMHVTNANRLLIRSWKSNTAKNFISAVEKDASPVVLQGASLVSDIEFEATADGVVELEFQGDAMNTP